MSKLDVVDLAEATQPVDWRSVRRLILACTAWITLQLGFLALVGNAIARPGRITAWNIGVIWIIADAAIILVTAAVVFAVHIGRGMP